MTADDIYSLQFETDKGTKGTLIATIAAPGPVLAATKVVGSAGAAWIQGCVAVGETEEVWVQTRDGMCHIEMPPDLAYPPPEPFAIKELVQTEQDRWHTQGFDVAPYARLFSEVRAYIEGTEPRMPERGANFRDAAGVQAVMDAARLSSGKRQWSEVEKV
jgi:predicted dehydrogenase